LQFLALSLVDLAMMCFICQSSD